MLQISSNRPFLIWFLWLELPVPPLLSLRGASSWVRRNVHLRSLQTLGLVGFKADELLNVSDNFVSLAIREGLRPL